MDIHHPAVLGKNQNTARMADFAYYSHVSVLVTGKIIFDNFYVALLMRCCKSFQKNEQILFQNRQKSYSPLRKATLLLLSIV
jgi:ABC-type polysaccharide/polyol phosphate export permease